MTKLPQLLVSGLLCMALGLPLATQAAGESEATPASSEIATLDNLIKEVAQQLLSRIKQDQKALNEDPERLYQMVDEVVLPYFDFPLMGRLVLGPQWSNATEEQQNKFLDSFKTLLVKTYGNALLQYSNEKILFSPAEMGSKPGRASVSSSIQSAGGEAVSMEYRMRKLGDRWLVYDVVVDNISLVTNYRGTYAAEIQRGGLDSLIAKLQEQAG